MMKKTATLLLPLLLLSGCGFSPVYGTQTEEGRAPVMRQLRAIDIDVIADRQGQILRNHLIDRMRGSTDSTKAETKLKVTLTTTESDLGIQKDATATRRQLSMVAGYELRSLAGKTLLKGAASSIVSYSRLEAQYGNVTAQRSAQERGLKEISEQIVNRLSLYFAEGGEQEPDPAFVAP